MSKGKKSAGKVAPQQDVNWEQALTEERLEKDDWKAYIVFVEAEGLPCLEHIASLHQVVGKGYRLKFGSITRDGLLVSAAEDMKKGQEAAPSGGKKSKQSNTQTTQIPHVAVCEQAVAASEKGNLSNALLAKLLKYQMLRMRDADIKKREARATVVTETDKPKASATKKGGGGGKSAGKTKGKNTPAPESDTVPLPSLPPSTMKKRGEEGDGPPPINDEPDDGPDYYFVISGFASVEFFSHLAPLGISPNALCKVNAPDLAMVEAEKLAKKPLSPPRGVSAADAQSSEEDTEEKKKRSEAVQQQLDDFWRDAELLIESTDTGSRLRDMAQVEIPTPSATVPSKTDDKERYGLGFFQSLSTTVYNLLEKYQQYQHYLEYVAFVDLDPASLQQGQDLFLTPTPSTTVLTPSQNTPLPPSGKPEAVLSPMPARGLSSAGYGSTSSQDRQYYSALLKELPQECVSVPIVLHCMVEQVVVNMSGADPLKAETEPKSVVDSSLFSDLMAHLAIPDDSTGQVKQNEDRTDGVPHCPHVCNQGDDAERRLHHISPSVLLDVKAVEACMQELSLANRTTSALSSLDKSTQGHVNSQRLALQHFSGSEVSPELLDTCLLQLACEQMPLSSTDMDPGLQLGSSLSKLEDSRELPVDYPFTVDVVETAPQGSETALVAMEEAERETASAGDDSSGKMKAELTLRLPSPRHSLLDFCILEKLSKHSLLQILNKDQHRRPYTDVYQHRMDHSLILASHSGCAEEPVGSYTWEKHYHTQVGFNNYLKHFDNKYSDKVEGIWLMDEEKKSVQEEEWKKVMAEKTQQLQEEAAVAATREASSRLAKKDKKGGKASADKKGKKDAQEIMPDTSAASLMKEEFLFQRSKAFSGYSIGDTVALFKSKVSTAHCPDGWQIRVSSSAPVEGSPMVQYCITGPDATLSTSLQFTDERKKAVVAVRERCKGAPDLSQKIQSRENLDPLQETADMQAEEEDKGPTEECSVDTLMQPPQGVLCSSLSATLGGYLHISSSSFGPTGDGSLPLPPKPKLSVPSAATPEQTSRPTSRKQSDTPKKLSKKDQEAQQAQLLEQQRLMEQQRKQEQERLLAAWEESCSKSLKECKVQELNLSTVAGLHVKCQVHTDERSAQVVIHQVYPAKTEGIQPCEKQRLQPLQERSRVLYPDGTLCKVLLDNSVEILTPNGTIYRSASAVERSAFADHVSSLQKWSTTKDADLPQGEETEQPVESSVGRSGSRVVFSGVPGEDDDSKANGHQDGCDEHSVSSGVWVVTLSSGEQYAWQSHKASGDGSKKKPLVEETITEEATGQQEADSVTEEGKKEEGKSICMPLSGLEIHSSVDPVTKEEMVVREDGMCLVRRPSGQVIVNYPDGTRFTTQHNSKHSSMEYVVVECSGFARIKYTFPDSSALITLPHGFTVHCSTKGDYTIEEEGSGTLSLSSEGLASYQPRVADCKYKLDYAAQNADAILTVCSNEYDACTLLSASSKGEIVQNADMHCTPSQHTPLYYIVREGGQCYQLMPKDQLDCLVKGMSSSPEKVVLQDVLAGDPMQKSVDLLIPQHCSDPSYHVVPYQEREIIPPNLRDAGLPRKSSSDHCSGSKPRFGLSVGKSLQIGSLDPPVPPPPVPHIKALLHRQFLVPYQKPQSLRSCAVTAVAKYVAWRNEEDKGLEDVLPCDSRDAEEKHSAARLEQDMAEEVSAKTSGGKLWDAYVTEFCSHHNTISNGSKKVAAQSATATKPGIKESTREEVDATKKALQSGTVPPYFESHDGQEFLATRTPDMQALSDKLAHPKMHQAYKAKVSFEDHSRPFQQDGGGGGPAEVSVCSTPSTTCSTAVPMGDCNSSPSPSEFGQVNTPSSVRPQNPTPYHADGNGTPTDARPLNPTPGHAFRDTLAMDVDSAGAMRPNNPTPALAYLGASGHTAASPSNFVPTHPAADYLEMQYEVDSPIADTIAALEQEDTVAGSDVNPSESKDLEEVDPPKQFNQSTYFTVAGERRQTEIPMPSSLLGSKPGEVANRHFTNVEEPVRRKVMTSSVAKPLASGVRTMPEMRGFELYPKEVAFGVLKEGCTYSCSVTIKNVGVDSCRFKIKQPPPSTGLKARYLPGPLAAGMKSVFEVEIYAMAVGAIGESSVGAIRHVLEIVTETSILHLPITAIILTQSAYETRLPIHPQGKHAPDVKLLSDRPTSRDRINRPSRDDSGQ